MAKKTKKTENTRQLTSNLGSFSIFGNAQNSENKLIETLEYSLELNKRQESNQDISSIALAQIITQRVNEKRLNALPSSPEVREIFRGIVEKYCTLEGVKNEEKISSMMSNATVITRIALLIASGDATVGITLKDSKQYLKKQPKAYDEKTHTRRIFLPENVPFSHKSKDEEFSSALKVASKERLIDTFKARFLGEPLLVELDDNGEEYCTKFGKVSSKNPESNISVSREKAKSGMFDLDCYINQSLWFSGNSVDKNERPQNDLFDGISVDALGTLEFKTKDVANIEFSEFARNLFKMAREILEIESKAQSWFKVNADFSESNGISDDVENDREQAKKSNGTTLAKAS